MGQTTKLNWWVYRISEPSTALHPSSDWNCESETSGHEGPMVMLCMVFLHGKSVGTHRIHPPKDRLVFQWLKADVPRWVRFQASNMQSVVERLCTLQQSTSFEPRKKQPSYFPWNPGCLIGILDPWFTVIFIWLGRISSPIHQPPVFSWPFKTYLRGGSKSLLTTFSIPPQLISSLKQSDLDK